MGKKQVIDIGLFEGLGLIIVHPSGVFYTSQVGGLYCLHPEIEGVFLPLPTDVNRYELNTLEQHFKGGSSGIDEVGVQLVDTVLRRSSQKLDWISVDYSRLKDSYEAWVHVKLNPEKTVGYQCLLGFENPLGVLVWPNSD